jgi:glutamate-1-semialdehyde 2,1-aminomutase
MITNRSHELYERAAASLVGGVGSGTRSPRSGWLPQPVFVRSGEAGWLTDEDGNRFLDLVMGQGPLILGHRPAAVVDAVTDVLHERGSLFSLAHDLEGMAAAALCERYPTVELVRFSSTGTEAAMYALRFARAITGRTLVVRFEGHYHGWSDAIHWSAHPTPDTWGGRPVPGSSGMPAELADTLLVLPWNDSEALEQAFTRDGERIAAVITEPILGNAGGLWPAAGYLERMRELTREAGAVLIFDEVLTGHRVAAGGAQQLLGIDPDLTVLAKAIGAGFPVAALGGRAEIMQMAADGRTMHGGTYNSSPMVCAAVVATARATGRDGFYAELDRRGRRLAEGLVSIARDTGLPASWSGVGGMFQLWFADQPPADYRAAYAIAAASPFPALHAELRDRGVLVQPPQEGLVLMSGAHTDEDVDRTLEAAGDAMPHVARAAARGEVGPRGGLR